MAKSPKRSLKPKSTPHAERIAGALGVLLLIGAFGYLLYAEAVSEAIAPDVAIERQAVQPSGDGFVVPLKVHNRNSFSAAKLKIRGELRSSGGGVETSETELDYLPGYSSRTAGLFFRHDPAGGALTIFPVSYIKP